MDTQDIVDTWRREAVQEGLKEGVKQGIKQGVEQGIKQGVEQGIKQGVAQSLVEIYEARPCGHPLPAARSRRRCSVCRRAAAPAQATVG